jgi:hypothetical protein
VVPPYWPSAANRLQPSLGNRARPWAKHGKTRLRFD